MNLAPRLPGIAIIALLTAPINAQTVLLFSNDLSAPNQVPVGNCGPDVDITLVNTLWGGTGAGSGGGGLWAQINTVETVLINGPGGVYTDPLDIGGDYCLGMLSVAEDDRAALTLDSEGLPFVNLYMDISAIDLVACAVPFGVAQPSFHVMVFDSPGAVFDIFSPGTLLDEDTLIGNAPGIDPYTFTWAAVQTGLDVTGSTDGNITVMLDLLTSGYAAFDNIVIEASISQAAIADHGASAPLALWPVPVHDRIQVSGAGAHATWSIVDALGVETGRGDLFTTEGIAVGTLRSAIYFLRVRDGSGTRTMRFIKE